MAPTFDHDDHLTPGAASVALALPEGDADAASARPLDPVFILSTSYSYTSIVNAMLGQHPQLYGLPELHLFGAETMADWWAMCRKTRWRAHGALRTVAELYFGAQSDDTIEQARGWLMRRSHLTTGMFLEIIAERVWPRRVIEKSPSITKSVARMKRAQRMFPAARYIHLLRHPRTQGESTIRHREQKRPRNRRNERELVEPPGGWYASNTNIRRFLSGVDPALAIQVRGEDLLADPDTVVRDVAGWLGLRTDAAAIEEVKHPERSPYACPGPSEATFGYNRNFLEHPDFRAGGVGPVSLDGPVSWRTDGRELPPWVKKMAREFGYE